MKRQRRGSQWLNSNWAFKRVFSDYIIFYHLPFLVVLVALHKLHFHKATRVNTYLSLNLERNKMKYS